MAFVYDFLYLWVIIKVNKTEHDCYLNHCLCNYHTSIQLFKHYFWTKKICFIVKKKKERKFFSFRILLMFP